MCNIEANKIGTTYFARDSILLSFNKLMKNEINSLNNNHYSDRATKVKNPRHIQFLKYTDQSTLRAQISFSED